LNGFLCIDKPVGPTSFSIVNAARKHLRTAKAGHAGTLDPRASGLMVIALGTTPRLLPYLSFEPKTYLFSIRFGILTRTLDMEGEIVGENGPIPSRDALEAVLRTFDGGYLQMPPDFSAKKIQGRRAYKIARSGKQPLLTATRVSIGKLNLLGYDEQSGEAHCTVTCSTGTYIRALVRDIAEGVGTIGTASSIRRTAMGAFSLEQALEFGRIEEAANYIIPAREVFRQFPSVQVTTAQRNRLVMGNPVPVEDTRFEGNPEDPWTFAYDPDNELVAVLKNKARCWYPVKVLVVSQGPVIRERSVRARQHDGELTDAGIGAD
jgi:tRNA pseudouridine55 synthase